MPHLLRGSSGAPGGGRLPCLDGCALPCWWRGHGRERHPMRGVRRGWQDPMASGLSVAMEAAPTPASPLRVDQDGKSYTGALCGLGWSPATGAPILPEHDMELAFDVRFSVEDVVEVRLPPGVSPRPPNPRRAVVCAPVPLGRPAVRSGGAQAVGRGRHSSPRGGGGSQASAPCRFRHVTCWAPAGAPIGCPTQAPADLARGAGGGSAHNPGAQRALAATKGSRLGQAQGVSCAQLGPFLVIFASFLPFLTSRQWLWK